MAFKFIKKAFFFFAHKYGQVIFAESKLEMHGSDIGVNYMCHNIKGAVGQPCAACAVVHVMYWELAGLHTADSEFDAVGFAFVYEG